MAIASVALLDGVVLAEQDAWAELLQLRTAAQLVGEPAELTMLCRRRWAPEGEGDRSGRPAAVVADWLGEWSDKLVRGFALPWAAVTKLADALGVSAVGGPGGDVAMRAAVVLGRPVGQRVPFADALELGQVIAADQPFGARSDAIAGAAAALWPVSALYRTGRPLLPIPVTDDAESRAVALSALLGEARRLADQVIAARARWRADHAAVRERHGRAGLGMQQLLVLLRDGPACAIPSAAGRLGLTRPAVAGALERLEADGLVREVTGRGRDRAWCYVPWVDGAG